MPDGKSETTDEAIDCLKAFVAETIDYMVSNKLGDPEKQHNVRWARSIIAKEEALNARR